MKNFLFIILLISGICCTLKCCIPNARKYVNTFLFKNLDVDSSNLSLKNKMILKYCHEHGKEISPTYKSAVCTEYVIKVISNFCKLNNKQKSEIRIITDKKIDELLASDSEVTKGVYTALLNSKLGTPVKSLEEVKAGDFVQFWNDYKNNYVGHCGIVRALDIKKGIISMYSSSPRTNGHGIQTYIIPKYIYFIRMK